MTDADRQHTLCPSISKVISSKMHVHSLIRCLQMNTGVNTVRFPSNMSIAGSVANLLSQGFSEFYPPFTSCWARCLLMYRSIYVM